MLFVRWIVLLLLLTSVGFFVASVLTGQARYRRTGLIILQWTIGAALVFFAVLAIERFR